MTSTANDVEAGADRATDAPEKQRERNRPDASPYAVPGGGIGRNNGGAKGDRPDNGPIDSSSDSASEDDEAEVKKPKKPTILERLGLSVPILLLMFKGSLPPIISLAMCQSKTMAQVFGSLGYLVAIISILSMSILPRGKYIQMTLLNVIAICTGAAFSLLAMWSATQARKHTSPPLTLEELQVIAKTRHVPYNSSQSAVSAIWLFFLIWLSNMVRAKLPAFNLPVIMFSIFVNVSCTYGAIMLNMTQAKTIVKQLLSAMLMGEAMATGVSLFIFPMTSRVILVGQYKGAIGLLRTAVQQQQAYLVALEREDMYALATVETAVGDIGPQADADKKGGLLGLFSGRKKSKNQGEENDKTSTRLTREQKAATALRTTIGAMFELMTKMKTELRFAKRDAAYGKLSAKDLGEMVRLLREVAVPVNGMSTIMDIFRRTAEHRGWNVDEDDEDEDGDSDEKIAEKLEERRVWNEVMKQLHEPFAILSRAIDQGLEHAALQLELLPRSKEQMAKVKAARAKRQGKSVPAPSATDVAAAGAADAGDVEGDAGKTVQPGDEGFAVVLEELIQKFYHTRSEILKVWAGNQGLLNNNEKNDKTDTSDFAKMSPLERTTSALSSLGVDPVFAERASRQSQLYVLLYMEQLMHATGEAVQNLVDFADSRVADGTMDRSRLLLPTLKRIYKWLISVFTDKAETDGEENSNGGTGVTGGKFDASRVIYTGDAFGAKKDPEHLPAETAWQHFGNGIRAIPAFFGSDESAFGFRVACATMTIGIVCYLERTQIFFTEQRLVWALIMVAISMMQTSGQSIFGFFCRVGGSFLSMVFCYIIWYIVDGKTAGVFVFLWLFIFCELYFLLKFMWFIPASMICIVTQVLILGYEMQTRVIGLAKAEANGQPYYPTYELAPYRLATVAGGCFVAFIWTLFPSVTTDRAWMRRDLSATLYLLANYFSATNETLKMALGAAMQNENNSAGDSETPGTPAYRLRKVRRKIMAKLLLMLPSLQSHSNWQKWEPTIGGKFPREAYEDIILRATRILNYLTLMAYTVSWKPRHGPDGSAIGSTGNRSEDIAWLTALTALVQNIGPTHYTILSTLTLLSNSLLSGQSLPPYIPLPRPYELTRQLLSLRQRPHHPHHHAEGQGRFSRSRRNTTSNTSQKGGFMSSRNGTQNGLYEIKDENEVMTSSSATGAAGTTANNGVPNWSDVNAEGIDTTTGSPTLLRMRTRQATTLNLAMGNAVGSGGRGGASGGGLGGVLDASNIDQHGYTEFAVLQVCSTLVCDDLEGMIQSVSGLVGVVDFSFRVDDSTDSVVDKGKQKEKTR